MISVARTVRLGLTAGAAAVLVTGLTTSAEAASGRIRYFNSAGEFVITNPPDGVCLTLRGPAQEVSNETNKTVHVFFTASCTNLVSVLDPGEAVSHIGGPRSVRVVP
ncbi:hypothetical protein ACFY71_09965 [Streptomyces cinerochromogenes]|uniref:hypothetical protein n=1 Tax=Streptomyces cinerochromogenes TaxID=66422 RepID=UPI0036CF9504